MLREIREGKEYKTAYTRLSKVFTTQVHEWAMSSLWTIQEGLEQYQSMGDPAALEEARRGAVALLAATQVLVDKAV